MKIFTRDPVANKWLDLREEPISAVKATTKTNLSIPTFCNPIQAFLLFHPVANQNSLLCQCPSLLTDTKKLALLLLEFGGKIDVFAASRRQRI